MEGKIVSALSQADTELSKFVEQQSVLSVRVEEEVSIDVQNLFAGNFEAAGSFLHLLFLYAKRNQGI